MRMSVKIHSGGGHITNSGRVNHILTFFSECFWFRFEEERSLSNPILLRQISKRVR